jgi:cyclopropane-fatty-acyl-phospholipid synthase
LGAAESYIDGDWTTDNLLAVMRIFTRNAAATAGLERRGWLASALSKWQHRRRHNSKSNSRRNIAAHYDLSNEFFALFLDESMTYSAGLFATDETTLHQASLAKIDRLCDKLQLQPDDHLLEIGTGWGALAIRAAEKYGCRVTTTTISRRQHEYAAGQIAARGLQNRIQLLDSDYRDLTGTYDKLVSVEMIEAVGHRYLPTFFAKCSRLLKPHGLAAIQAITIPDQRYAAYIKGVDFIQKYIFPGGCLPSIGAMQQAAAQHTDLRIVELADFADDYARTLSCWRERFWQQIESVRDLGLPDEFIRMWDWYLCYCEAAYRERLIGLAQIVWAKPQAQ